MSPEGFSYCDAADCVTYIDKVIPYVFWLVTDFISGVSDAQQLVGCVWRSTLFNANTRLAT